MRVGICIATYKRIQELARCLESLGRLQLPYNSDLIVEVFVVDNDAKGSARLVVKSLREKLPFLIHYDVEPRRGIPFARNRAVRMAQGCDFIAFIDDDETAHRDWLNQLLETQSRYNADLVAGPAIPEFDRQAPKWLKQSQLFNKRRLPTGESIHWASTCNCLIRTATLLRIPGPFDPRLATTGGSDRLLTLQLSRRGYKLIWCNEALVTDHIPIERTTVTWYLQRKYREGNTIAVCEALMPPDIRQSSFRLVAKALFSLARVMLWIPLEIRSDKVTKTRILGKLLTNVGILAGLMGHQYHEYSNSQ